MSVFCNVPQAMQGREELGTRRLFQWPRGHVITWHVDQAPRGFDRTEAQQHFKTAFDLWEAVCGVRYKFVTNARLANLFITTRRIDGPAGVLAEAELPMPGTNATSQYRVWFDEEFWTIAENWQGAGRFPLITVAAHEFGHSSGLGHDEDGRTNALMDPSVSNISTPQDSDIAEMVARYGEKSGGGVGGDGDEYDELGQTLADCLRRWSRS